MKAGLSDWRALVVTIPSETCRDTGSFLVGLALPEQTAMPNKSKATSMDRQAIGSARKPRIFMTLASTSDPLIARNLSGGNSFSRTQRKREPIGRRPGDYGVYRALGAGVIFPMFGGLHESP
jgi:hypothetical protein